MLPPRMDEDEIEYFKEFLLQKKEITPEAQMTEWGSGGSTLMFMPYFSTGKFISIEHNQEWFSKVVLGINGAVASGELKNECVANTVYCLAEPKLDIRFYGYGIPYEENPVYAADYIFPKIEGEDVWNSDIYFVDGICRGAVLATIAMKAKKREASVFLHDHHGPENREPWYEWATGLYTRTEKVGSTLARLYL